MFIRIRNGRVVLFALVIAIHGVAGLSHAGFDEPEIEIQAPEDQTVYDATRQSIQLEGLASVPGTIPKLDLMLVLDTSRSLKNSDPYAHRIIGSMELIDTLPDRGDVRIGIISFGRTAELLVPLTTNRKLLADGIRDLNRGGFTEISEGVRLAVDVLATKGRRDARRSILMFSDGRSNPDSLRAVAEYARNRSIAIHCLQLGPEDGDMNILREVAATTGGYFDLVRNTKNLPDQLLRYRTSGMKSVVVRVNGTIVVRATLTGDRFALPIALVEGENRIETIATSLSGKTASDKVTVYLRPTDGGQTASGEVAVYQQPTGCGVLRITAEPSALVSKRSVEIILDVSGSMWGKTNGRIKMRVASETLRDSLSWLPPDIQLGLRVYGHQSDRYDHNCRDTTRLIEPALDNRDRIRSAISTLTPKGQTPIAYSLEQAAQDLRLLAGDRSIVLLTDGNESCGGDGPAAARALQQLGSIPVHVIGFGMENEKPATRAQLKEIARVSGGLFLTAANTTQLRDALRSSIGTPYEVLQDNRTIAAGSLGNAESLALPAGLYEVRVGRSPMISVLIEIKVERSHRMTFAIRRGRFSSSTEATKIERFSCDIPTWPAEDSVEMD